MIKATAQGIEGYGLIAKKSSTAKGVREIRGFVSTTNMDRQGDSIDPILFDVGTFIKNPQVFVDHQPWITGKGNPVSVGRVISLAAAKAKENGKDGFDIVSLENDEVIDTVPKDEADIVENDMKGLWGVLQIMEDDVIKLVNDGRLNAFSWRGDLVETRFGKHIDLMEVSLVFIPANAKALFMITKSAVRNTESYVVIKGGGMFADIRELPENVAAVVDVCVPKYCLYIKREDDRAELMELTLGNDAEADAFSASVYAARADVESVTLMKHTYLMTDHEEPIYEVMNDLSRTEMIRATWTRAYINDLPDTCFGHVEPGGTKEDGKTSPRSLRHFPLKDKNGKYDVAHVRNALARMSQSEFGDKAKPKIMAAARAMGIAMNSKSVEDIEDGHDEVLEGGEEDMAISKEDTATIGVAVAAAVRGEFQKVLDEIDSKIPKADAEPVKEAVSDEGEKKDEAVVAVDKSPESLDEKVDDVEKAQSTAGMADTKDAMAQMMAAMSTMMAAMQKRVDKLETQPVVTSQQATEATSEVVEKKKSLAELYQAVTDPDEKRKMRLIMLSEACFSNPQKAVSS